MPNEKKEFATRIELIKIKLYRTAYLYLRNEASALEAVDETVYKGLKSFKKLREPKYFDTWITRLLINECKKELNRLKRMYPTEYLPEIKEENYDVLPLKDAISKLPEELQDVIILTFSAKEPDEGVRRQLWAMKYYDLEGKEYSINAYSSVDGGYYDEEKQEYIQIPGSYQHQFALVDYPYGVVYLCPPYSRIVSLPIPVEIKIK